ncbi:MAG: hypothetical protein CMJ18_13575 [Phycisphaeraceae bacterium]|nr:hypothetical protein [Phycisphaeraceae bacterium]
MTTTTRNIRQDAAALWKSESRDFLDYAVTVATPLALDETDEKISVAFQEAWEAEQPLIRRLYTTLAGLGITADRPACGFSAPQYNFVRGVVLGQAWLRFAIPDLARMQEMRAAYDGDLDSLEERQLRAVLDDFISARQDAHKVIDKLLLSAANARAAAAGEAVEDDAGDAPVVADGEYPWHNEDMELVDRMKLAEGKGLFENLYAAMAQTDCTACGYDCEGYAQAIADGEEADLTKCAPGEQETQEMLERLTGK